MKRDNRKFHVIQATKQDLIDLKDNNDYFHYPEIIEIKNKKYVLSAGRGDAINLFSDNKDFTYILTSQQSMNYAGLEKICHKFNSIHEIVFIQNTDNLIDDLHLKKDFFDYSVNTQVDILKQYEE